MDEIERGDYAGYPPKWGMPGEGKSMRIAIISDTHFGDFSSQLVTVDTSGQIQLGSRYAAFRDAAGRGNDYLVLLGDIVDVAINEYKIALDIFKRFLSQVHKDGIAERILYIPGNHDYDLWHAIEYQANIINPIIERKPTKQFRMSVPAVLDDRQSAKYEILLGNVTRRPDPKEPYGYMFLDSLCDEEMRFLVGFPNAYLITDTGECIVMTHGQYFQVFWSLISEWAPKVFQADLRVNQPLSIKNVVELNFPLSQLSSSGVGQAGPLTDVTRQMQYDFKKGIPDRLRIYLDNFCKKMCAEILKPKWYNPFDWLKKGALNRIKKSILKGLSKPHLAPKEEENWGAKPETLKKISEYYLSACDEIRWLNSSYDMNIPDRPNKLIFGHTHKPIALQALKPPSFKPFIGTPFEVRVFNTGAWLEGKGAELFLYETGKGLWSVPIN